MWRCAASLLVLTGLLFSAEEADSARNDAPKLYGIAYGAFRDGQSPIGAYPSEAEVKEDMKVLRDFARGIRTYSVARIQQEIPRLAKRRRLVCYAGAHISSDREANALEVERLLDVARNCRRGGIAIGNEVLPAEGRESHRTLPPGELAELIRQVKGDKRIRRMRIPVGYAEAYEVLGDYRESQALGELVAELDFLMVNAHPYWAGQSIEGAADWVYAAWQEAQGWYPGKRIIIGETGWPTAGETQGEAVPSEENQRIFLEDFVALALEENIPYFFFEAFDERWKSELSGRESEAHWGLWHSDRSVKQRVGDFFTSPPALAEILRPARCGGGPGRMHRISGRVYGIERGERSSYRLVIYAKTNQWYIQPFVAEPFTKIRQNLTWFNRTHLGDLYAALLVRDGYLPTSTLQQLPEAAGDVIAIAVKDCR